MKALLDYVSTVTDCRQEKKVRHKMMDIIMLVFFATLANADDWVEIEVFGKEHEDFLRNYLELPYGIPSHDTLQRVFAMVPSEFLENFQTRWNEMLNSEEGEKVKRLLAIDGKTQRGNGKKDQKGNHIVSAVDERGFCLGQKRVEEKTNEITAIPELLDSLNIKGTIITTDAMGTQTAIVKKIRRKRADYVLALKGNQGSLLEDVREYFSDEKLLEKCAYKQKVEKARGKIEKTGILADRRYLVAEPEERVGGVKEHNPDTEYYKGSRWKRDRRGEIFYQQPANRYRRGRKSSEGALDGRKLSLAFRCDISGRWESHIREAGGL